MRIALVQQHATEDKSDNLKRGLDAFEEAAANNAELVCYAELAFEPFYPQRRAGSNVLELAEPVPGPVTDAFCKKAAELGVEPLAVIRAVGKGACHPAVMGLSPVPAVHNLMKRSGLVIEDFELVEVNEAFAAQYIGCERELGLNREITNVNGSGIGLGHPVGATGCRIMVTLLNALRKRGKSLGLATLCGGGGVSMACAVEMV